MRDSSAITIIDSYSTRVTAEFNCNFISTQDLAAVIYEIVSRWMPNAIVNIERNGGYGASVLAKLLTTSIKNNLYYTIKDKVVEERFEVGKIIKKTQKTKIYGSDSTHAEREQLMEILRDRVEYHKDKIISKTIYDELCGLEVKKNGRIEHSANTHDDQVFSWLWALHVWYNGGDLANSWGIQKHVLRTDADLEEAILDINEPKSSIITEIDVDPRANEDVDIQLKALKDAPGKLMYQEWAKKVQAEDEAAMQRILDTKIGREAYERQFHTKLDSQENTIRSIPNEIFEDFYRSDIDILGAPKVDMGNLASIWSGVK